MSINAAGLLALRVHFDGEFGYEFHQPIETRSYIFDRLMATGASFGIRPYGLRAIDSLRPEKSCKLVGCELSVGYAALESDLTRFVDLKKGDFLGRQALLEKDFANRLVAMEVKGVIDADACGSEPVFRDGAAVGRTTSGGFGWRTGKSLALAMVRPEYACPGEELDILILRREEARRRDRRQSVRPGQYKAA